MMSSQRNSRLVRTTIVLCYVAVISMLQTATASAATMTQSGQITWLIAGGFSLQTTSCGHLPVYINRNTQIFYNGQSIAPGVYAQAVGSGSCNALTATQIVLIPKHVLTSDYLGAPYGSSKYSWSSYARWLSWAEVSPPYANAIATTGIKTILYTNPNRQQPGDNMYTSDETTFAHTCSGLRIHNTNSNPSLNLMQPSSLNLQGLWRSTTNSVTASNHYDIIFEDDADDVLQTSALPCGYTSSSWTAKSQALNSSLGKTIIYNGLGVLSPGYGISTSIALNSTTSGGMMESCYSQPDPRPLTQGTVWQTTENTEIIMAQQRKFFICYAKNYDNASTSLSTRLYTYASFLLTYDINTSLLWEYFANPSGFHVEPESMLVATNPLIATPGNISGLLTSTGTYGREYASCYIGGLPVGPCATVVNPDYASARAFPYSKYHHTLVLSGGGILDGGTVSTRGAAPGKLPPYGAAIVFL